MATRLHYALPIAKHFLSSTTRRFRPGGLAATLPPPTRREPFFIVTGAGRSGTSAVTRVLHESGIRMGSDFDEPTQYNATGYYQERAVYIVNEEMLAEMGMAGFKGANRWASRSTVLAVAEGYANRLAEIAASDTDGWKDPIFSATLEAWLPYLPCRPKLIVCLRSPAAYASSVMNIYGVVNINAVMKQWANHYRRLLEVIRDYQLEATCVEYDNLIAAPEETVAELSRFAGRPLDAQYVRGDLRRFVHQVPKRYTRLYHRVRALGGGSHAAAGSISNGAARPAAAKDVEPPERYMELVRAIEERVAAAKRSWDAAAGMPQPVLHSNGTDSNVRAATEAHVAVVSEAQQEIAALAPAPAFETYHDLLRVAVDYERLAAQLLLSAYIGAPASPGSDLLSDSVSVWRRFCSPEATAKAAAKRERELEKARRRSARNGG